MLKLFKLGGSSIIFSMWNASSCGANVEMAMLVVASMWWLEVEVEFDIDRIGGEEVVVMVSVRQHMELAKALSPLLRALGVGGVGKK